MDDLLAADAMIRAVLPADGVVYLILRNSTSNTKVALAGMTGG